jgi:hypothetical protein
MGFPSRFIIDNGGPVSGGIDRLALRDMHYDPLNGFVSQCNFWKPVFLSCAEALRAAAI